MDRRLAAALAVLLAPFPARAEVPNVGVAVADELLAPAVVALAYAGAWWAVRAAAGLPGLSGLWRAAAMRTLTLAAAPFALLALGGLFPEPTTLALGLHALVAATGWGAADWLVLRLLIRGPVTGPGFAALVLADLATLALATVRAAQGPGVAFLRGP